MGVSIDGGTPKWMVYDGRSYKSCKNRWFGGARILGDLHIPSNIFEPSESLWVGSCSYPQILGVGQLLELAWPSPSRSGYRPSQVFAALALESWRICRNWLDLTHFCSPWSPPKPELRQKPFPLLHRHSWPSSLCAMILSLQLLAKRLRPQFFAPPQRQVMSGDRNGAPVMNCVILIHFSRCNFQHFLPQRLEVPPPPDAPGSIGDPSCPAETSAGSALVAVASAVGLAAAGAGVVSAASASLESFNSWDRHGSRWRFPKKGIPPVIIHFSGILAYKPSIFGYEYPHFRKPPDEFREIISMGWV